MIISCSFVSSHIILKHSSSVIVKIQLDIYTASALPAEVKVIQVSVGVLLFRVFIIILDFVTNRTIIIMMIITINASNR